MKMTCISCKYFRIEDPLSGFCRALSREQEKTSGQKTMVRTDDSCGKWVDCGQQYYIRLGWVKAYTAREAKKNTQ